MPSIPIASFSDEAILGQKWTEFKEAIALILLLLGMLETIGQTRAKSE
jgi:hypothetical protein